MGFIFIPCRCSELCFTETFLFNTSRVVILPLGEACYWKPCVYFRRECDGPAGLELADKMSSSTCLSLSQGCLFLSSRAAAWKQKPHARVLTRARCRSQIRNEEKWGSASSACAFEHVKSCSIHINMKLERIIFQPFLFVGNVTDWPQTFNLQKERKTPTQLVRLVSCWRHVRQLTSGSREKIL